MRHTFGAFDSVEVRRLLDARGRSEQRCMMDKARLVIADSNGVQVTHLLPDGPAVVGRARGLLAIAEENDRGGR